MNEKEMRDGLAYVRACLADIHTRADGRGLTDDEQTAWDAGRDYVAATERSLKNIADRKAELARHAANPFNVEDGDGAVGAPQVMRRVEPFDGTDVRTLPDMKARDKALKALEDRNLTLNATDAQIARAEKVLRTRTGDCNGSHIARRLLITENEHYRNAFIKLITRSHPVLNPDEQRAVEAYDEFRAMSIGTDASGGFGVPVLIDPTIMLTAQGSPNDLLNIARVETITNDEWKGVTSAGATWSFDAEAAEVSDDSVTLAQPAVPTYTARGFVPYSIEVGMDYPNFASEMAVLLDEGYRELLAQKLTVGSGAGEPTGVVTKLDATTASEVLVTTDGAFAAADVYRLWDSLPIKYRNRMPSWMSSTDVMNEVRQFGSGGSGGSNFSVNLTQDTIPQLFGKPYYENDFMDDFTSTTGAANLVVLGDFKNFLVAQRAGMSVELVPHLLHTSNNRPSGQRGWFAWARVGSDVINPAGMRLLQNA